MEAEAFNLLAPSHIIFAAFCIGISVYLPRFFIGSSERTIYSNPPSHGSDIVKTILSDDFLRKIWMENLDNAKNRIIDMRNSLITNLIDENCSRNFDFIANQKGMFSFTGLTENEVAQLKEKFSIYIVKSGRINVAGITSSNVKYIAKAISGVI